MASGEGDLLESHRAEIAVLYCQLIGFASFAERAEPEEVAEVLGAFRMPAGQEVHRAQATLAAFTSEGLMAFLNDPMPCPDPPRRAVDLALALREAVSELAVGWQRLGYALGCGIGVSWGTPPSGRTGPPERWDYGPSGSIVTLSARLAEHASDRQILLSQRAQAAVAGQVEGETLSGLAAARVPRPGRRVLGHRTGRRRVSRGPHRPRDRGPPAGHRGGVEPRHRGRLYITEATAARHVSNIFGKLGAHTRAEATRIAVRRGLLEPGDATV